MVASIRNTHSEDAETAFVRINAPVAADSMGSHAENKQKHEVHLTIGGELSISDLPHIWPQALNPLRQMHADRITIDASTMRCTDTACLALFAAIRRVVAADQGELNIVGLQPSLKALVDMATLDDPTPPQLRPPGPVRLILRIGEITAGALSAMKVAVSFVGELVQSFAWAAAHPKQVRWRELAIACEKAGADAVPVGFLLGFLIGVMLAFQSAEQTERYGVRTVIPSVVVIAVTRELGPLIATLLLAGRTASAFAAELGNMKVNEELNALRAMGLDPVRFLVLPRVLSVMLVAPLLAVFCDLAGVLGGYTVMADHGFSFIHYVAQVGNSVNWPDVFGGVGKTIVSGLLIGAAGCLHGLKTGSGPTAVGDSTTRAVVSAIVLAITTDGCFGVIYYYFGI